MYITKDKDTEALCVEVENSADWAHTQPFQALILNYSWTSQNSKWCWTQVSPLSLHHPTDPPSIM